MLPMPLWQKLAALMIAFGLIIAAYYYMSWIPLQDEIYRQRSQVKQQQEILTKRQNLARDLPRKQKEYANLEKQLKVALNMLPRKSQIPDLLENVSWAGKDSGLEFKSFTPGNEIARQIYAEVPVSFNISGSYRQLLTFLKRVGEMQRIVDIKNMRLKHTNTEGELSVKGQAVTYRFMEKTTDTPHKRRRK